MFVENHPICYFSIHLLVLILHSDEDTYRKTKQLLPKVVLTSDQNKVCVLVNGPYSTKT